MCLFVHVRCVYVIHSLLPRQFCLLVSEVNGVEHQRTNVVHKNWRKHVGFPPQFSLARDMSAATHAWPHTGQQQHSRK